MSVKKINYLIIGILIVASIIYVFVFNSISGGNKVEPLLKQIKQSVEAENWQEAQSSYEELRELWMGKTAFWVALNFAEAEFSLFEQYLNKVASSIEYEDQTKALDEIDIMLGQWDNFNKIVPKP